MIYPVLRRVSITLFVIASLSGLTGCAPSPERYSPQGKPVSANASREKLALDLMATGELAEALIQWKILSTIEPSSEYYLTQVHTSTLIIDKKSKDFVTDGVTSLRQGAREAARLSFLKALALNPKNIEAFENLRQLAIQFPAVGQNTGKPVVTCCKHHSVITEVKE